MLRCLYDKDSSMLGLYQGTPMYGIYYYGGLSKLVTYMDLNNSVPMLW